MFLILNAIPVSILHRVVEKSAGLQGVTSGHRCPRHQQVRPECFHKIKFNNIIFVCISEFNYQQTQRPHLNIRGLTLIGKRPCNPLFTPLLQLGKSTSKSLRVGRGGERCPMLASCLFNWSNPAFFEEARSQAMCLLSQLDGLGAGAGVAVRRRGGQYCRR